jgi:hypothetical protein
LELREKSICLDFSESCGLPKAKRCCGDQAVSQGAATVAVAGAVFLFAEDATDVVDIGKGRSCPPALMFNQQFISAIE